MNGPDFNTHETQERSGDDRHSPLFWFRCSRLLLATWALLALSLVSLAVSRSFVTEPTTARVVALDVFLVYLVAVVLGPSEFLHNRGWTRWARVSVVASVGGWAGLFGCWCWEYGQYDIRRFVFQTLFFLGPVFVALATARWASSLRERGVLRPQSLLRRAILPLVVVISAAVFGYLTPAKFAT